MVAKKHYNCHMSNKPSLNSRSNVFCLFSKRALYDTTSAKDQLESSYQMEQDKKAPTHKVDARELHATLCHREECQLINQMVGDTQIVLDPDPLQGLGQVFQEHNHTCWQRRIKRFRAGRPVKWAINRIRHNVQQCAMSNQKAGDAQHRLISEFRRPNS